MSDNKSQSNRPSFWTTLPGLLTGCAALITAVAGLIGALAAIGIFSSSAATPLPPPTASGLPTNTPTIPQPTEDSDNALPVNVTGAWLGANGLGYVLTQNGSTVTIQEVGFGGQVTASGQGSIVGNLVEVQYQGADGSSGLASLTVSGDGLEMVGTFTNLPFGQSTPAVLYRE